MWLLFPKLQVSVTQIIKISLQMQKISKIQELSERRLFAQKPASPKNSGFHQKKLACWTQWWTEMLPVSGILTTIWSNSVRGGV
jgi:hypothetical protein